jgi:DivIVA domain-containing protein
MDLTPDILHQQEFREARRGYDMREVDEFLERVAVAVEELLQRSHASMVEAEAARSRVAQLEQEVQQRAAAGPDSSDETMQRTLLLAQKTADAAVADAEAQAAKLLERAEQQAEFVVKEAESSAERSRLESESHARRAGEETRRRMLEEITTLERAREVMHADVRALRRYLDDQRTRMRTAARDLQRLVEDPTALKEFSPPVTSDQQPEPEPEPQPEADGAAVEDHEPPAPPPPPPPPPPSPSPPEGPRAAATDVAGAEVAEPEVSGPLDPAEPDGDGDYFEELRIAMSEEGDPSPS